MQVTYDAAVAVVQFIDTVVTRGSIRGEELAPVAGLRAYYVDYANSVKPASPENITVNTAPAAVLPDENKKDPE